MNEKSFSPPWLIEILELERDWLRCRALNKQHIEWLDERLFDYALRLARCRYLRLPDGRDLDLAPSLEEFRIWLLRTMREIQRGGDWEAFPISVLGRELKPKLRDLRSSLFLKFADLSPEILEEELCKKKLALVLAGGGGTGFAHLPVFQRLEELGHTPDLITGTSLGALLGYYRAIKRSYDPALSYLQLPQWADIARSIRPFLGGSRHGMPALFSMNLSPLVSKMNFDRLANESPSFKDLEIPFACVTTGVKKDAKTQALIQEPQKSSIPKLLSLGLFPWKKTYGAILKLSQFLSSHPDLISELVLGFDSLSENLSAVNGIAFSTLVPSLLTYEISNNHHQDREILDTLFLQNDIFRCVDGGLANNMPASVAFNAIQEGRIKSRNSFILAIDVFAPCAKINALFLPLQQIANGNVLENLPYADAYKRLQYVLSPINLAPSIKQLVKLNAHVMDEMDIELKTLSYALKPLPRFEDWA